MKKLFKIAAIGGASALALTGMAHAGTSGTEFQEAYELILGWLNGYMGKLIALAFFATGLFMGVARQNLLACGIAIAVAFGIVIVPGVLDGVMTATLSADTAVAAIEAPVVK
ncbi:pili assembly chaperone [Sinirhodobacter populi]|uniref:Pili assembly chaperone n=1 Tax=Paenirhodobacter populi TaxID=2306993 RepID=A0A443KD38_9RHOB|nr:TraA family conjugative transfer protein [Sinirhodobacter populi]RWR30552.1 pili assembly chaperone [Sinirhodobacter populi]